MTTTIDRADWPMCAAGCGWRLHPAATMGWDGTPGVYDTHPTCDAEAMGRPMTEQLPLWEPVVDTWLQERKSSEMQPPESR